MLVSTCSKTDARTSAQSRWHLIAACVINCRARGLIENPCKRHVRDKGVHVAALCTVICHRVELLFCKHIRILRSRRKDAELKRGRNSCQTVSTLGNTCFLRWNSSFPVGYLLSMRTISEIMNSTCNVFICHRRSISPRRDHHLSWIAR